MDKDKTSEQYKNHQEKVLETQIIPVMEEFFLVNKKNLTTGKVYIHKKVKEENVNIDIPLERQEVKVERVSINKYVDGSTPACRQEGDTTIIPVLAEVVEKRLVLVEEIRLTKHKVEYKEMKTVNLKKEEITVERTKGTTSGDSGL